VHERISRYRKALRALLPLLSLSPGGAGALEIVATLDVGKQPKQVAISPDGRTAYVTNFGGGSVSVIDVNARRVEKTLRLGGAPVEVAFAPDGRFAYVTNFRPGKLWKLDTATHAVAAEAPGHLYPKGVAVSPDGSRVYFSSWWWPEGFLTELDTATLKLRRTMRLGNRPRGTAVGLGGKLLAICNFGEEFDDEGRGLDLVDAARLQRVARLDTGVAPRHVITSADGRRAYVSNLGSSSVSIVDLAKRRIAKQLFVGGGPKTLGLSPDGATLYVADYSARRAVSVDLRTGKVNGKVKLGDRGSGLAVSPSGEAVLVTGWDRGKLFFLKP
jgi:YVTN family beta-propeller protein